MNNIKDFDLSLIKLDKKSYRHIGIYDIGYIKTKKIDDYENINSVNQLYLIIGKTDRYMEENNGNKYLLFTSTDGNKKVFISKKEKFKKLLDKTKHLIETINEVKKGEHKKYFMKIINLIQMTINL